MKRFTILLSLAIITVILVCCGGSDSQNEANSGIETTTVPALKNADTLPVRISRIKVRPIGSYSRVFNDKNDAHLAVARKIGIRPISSLQDAYNQKVPLLRIYTCNDFFIEELTHSLPYLVPQAARLLHDIGRSFSDTIEARGGSKYKIRVTSVTRTDHSVAKLRRNNVNATVESAHRYGTTFDISYIKFIPCDSSRVIATQDLRGILAEILKNMRDKGRCLVKYEIKQGCFHVTAI